MKDIKTMSILINKILVKHNQSKSWQPKNIIWIFIYNGWELEMFDGYLL